MSEEIAQIAERLRELSTRLRDPELPDEEAEALAREAAELAARGGTEIDRALREIAERGAPDLGEPA
jgi:methyl-accepting chemotaxis protein